MQFRVNKNKYPNNYIICKWTTCKVSCLLNSELNKKKAFFKKKFYEFPKKIRRENL